MSAEETDDARQPARAAYAALVVGQLLLEARNLLARDPEAAHRHIDQAAALLHGGEAAEGDAAMVFRRGGLAPWQMRRLRDHVAVHLSGRLATTDLAAVAGLSPSYFSAAFRVSFGCSPHAYVTEQRIRAAQTGMTTTALPLAQIALLCGFSDQPHFCRQFRRVTGLTPADWRRRHVETRPAIGPR